MEANKILQSDILDIIFEGKNKSYGAYDLRKTYNKRLKKALAATGALLLIIFAGIVLGNTTAKKKNEIFVTDPIIIGKLPDEIPPVPIVPKAPTEKINTVAYKKPIVVDNSQVDPNQQIAEIHDNQTIDNTTVVSTNTEHIVQGPISDPKSTVIDMPVKNTEPIVWTDVQVPADFPGGFAAWKKYLEKNLDPETAINNGAGEGTYTVIVNFIVSKDGSISNVTAVTKIGYGLEEEAIKIIKRGPKWTPAMQNGQQVNAYRNQPITFVVSGN